MVQQQLQPRSTAARIGIVALNLLAPGLGLLRTGRWRVAVMLLLAPYAAVALVLGVLMHAPPLVPGVWLGLTGAAVAGTIALFVSAIWRSWRTSATRPTRLRWWSRWYAIAGVVIMGWIASQLIVLARDAGYKTYYVPSESMRPTLAVDDRFVTDQRDRDPVRVGDIVVVAVGSVDYVQRVVAIGGNRVEVRGGVPIVDGRTARQFDLGRMRVDDAGGAVDARLLRESLPGAGGSHRVLDLGYSPGDDFGPVTVPSDHYFLLGDNRDRSADSRFGSDMNGSGMVARERIRGRALFKVLPIEAFGQLLGK